MNMKKILQLTAEKLRCAALPLGGIGTGTISIGGDGLLKQWQITNTVKHDAFIPNSFFSVWTKKKGESNESSVCRALICPKVHDYPDFKPAESISDHKIPLAAKEMFKILPGIEEIQFYGEYPIAFLEFIDPLLPIHINLTTYNPFIPLDPKNSGLPILIFHFNIKNISDAPCEVSLAGSILNFLGWDGMKVFKGTESILFAGDKNEHKKIGEWNALYMTTKTLLKTDRRYGDITFIIDKSDAMNSTQWSTLKDFWNQFSKEGYLPKSESEELSPLGQTWTGSLGWRATLNPGENIEAKFFLAWNFPNRVVDWIIDKTQIPDKHTEFWIGNYYNEWFKNSLDLIKYLQQNLSQLEKKTKDFHNIMFSTTLPPEVITSITATMSTIRSPSCFWMNDGSFHGFEGCHGASTWKSSGGCCPLDCTHVWNYEFSLAHLFPSLERIMRETEYKMQHESGYLPHRSVIPLYLPQLVKEGNWDVMGPAIDGMFGTILKIYRDFLITGDREFLKKSWQLISRMMDYIFEFNDKELKGVIYSEQPNTYDCTLYGINTFIGSLYLTALLTCEKITKELNIPDLPEKFKKIYTSGKQILDQECWNGEYYIQKYDKDKIKEHQYGIGCHSDQLFGQWWAFELGYGYILPPEHVNKAVESIVRYNFKETLEDIQQFRIFASPTDPGLLNCTWPYGEQPSIPTRYTNEVWTGIEYEVAALCIYTGKIPEALKIINAVRKRYDGTRRNPWNEVECGDHYVRAMSSWTLLHALTGIDYIMGLKQIKFGPNINAENFKTFFITGTSWGQVTQQLLNNKVSFSVTIYHGELELKSILLIKLMGRKPKESSVLINKILKGEKKPVEATLFIKDSKAEIMLKAPVILKETHQLVIELS
jgi:non-lysosomal glucosylceramidase